MDHALRRCRSGELVAGVLSTDAGKGSFTVLEKGLTVAELTTAAGGVTAGVLSDGWSPWLTALLALVEVHGGDVQRDDASHGADEPRVARP